MYGGNGPIRTGELLFYRESDYLFPTALRHTAAMELLQAGVDRALIAIWLGHESLETTQIYLDADLQLKKTILDKMHPTRSKPARYRPDDQLLSYLKGL